MYRLKNAWIRLKCIFLLLMPKWLSKRVGKKTAAELMDSPWMGEWISEEDIPKEERIFT
jgi:hypothetical protein